MHPPIHRWTVIVRHPSYQPNNVVAVSVTQDPLVLVGIPLLLPLIAQLVQPPPLLLLALPLLMLMYCQLCPCDTRGQ